MGETDQEEFHSLHLRCAHLAEMCGGLLERQRVGGFKLQFVYLLFGSLCVFLSVYVNDWLIALLAPGAALEFYCYERFLCRPIKKNLDEREKIIARMGEKLR